MTNRLMLVLIVFFSLIIVSCEKHTIVFEEIDTTIQLDFAAEILPIFANSCESCHSGGIPPNLTAANAYNSLIDGNYINTENPESSLIYTKLNPAGTHNSVPNQADLDKILLWIEQGAKSKVEQIDFATTILPIFASDCASCHSGSQSPKLTAAEAYNSLINGNFVNTVDPESSIIYIKFQTSGTHVGRTNQANLANILVWIQQGAKETAE